MQSLLFAVIFSAELVAQAGSGYEAVEGRFQYPGLESVAAEDPGEPFWVWRSGPLVIVQQGERFAIQRRLSDWLFIDHNEKLVVKVIDRSSGGLASVYARAVFPPWPGEYGFAETEESFHAFLKIGFKDVNHKELGEDVKVADVYEFVDPRYREGKTTWLLSKSSIEPRSLSWWYVTTDPHTTRSMAYLGSFVSREPSPTLFAIPEGYSVVVVDSNLNPPGESTRFSSKQQVEQWLASHDATRVKGPRGAGSTFQDRAEVAEGDFIYPGCPTMSEPFVVWRIADRILVNQGHRFTLQRLEDRILFVDHMQKLVVAAMDIDVEGLAWRHAKLIFPIMPGTFGYRETEKQLLEAVQRAGGIERSEHTNADPPAANYSSMKDPAFPDGLTSWSTRLGPGDPWTLSWWYSTRPELATWIMGYSGNKSFARKAPPESLFDIPSSYAIVEVDRNLKPLVDSNRLKNSAAVGDWLKAHHAIALRGGVPSRSRRSPTVR